MKKNYWFLFAAVIGIAFTVGGMPTVYAEDGDTDEFVLEEITVTAEKRDTNLQKTAISIQTVSGVELTSEAKTRIDDIMQGVVGVQTQAGQVGTDFFMRGLGKAEGNNPVSGLSQAAVAVVIDGVYQNRGEVVRGGTVDMAQAEVMRGTQSTTLGGSSLAGAVSMVSNNPVFNYEGSGSLGVGDYNLLTTQAVLNVPFSDNQAARIAYSSENRDGYLSNNAGNSDQTNGRIKYRYQPNEDIDLVATVSKQIIGGNGVDTNSLTYYGYWEAYDPATDAAGGYDATIGYPILYGHVDNGVKYDDRDNPWDDGMPDEAWPNQVFRNTKIHQYSLNLDWDLAIGTLSVVPSYQTAKFHSQESPRASTEGGESWNAELREQETTQLDMQLASPGDAPFEWLAGAYYYDTEFSGYMYSANFNVSPMGELPDDVDSSAYYDWEMTNPSIQKTYAAYGNVSYPVLDVLRLNAGLRYTKDEKSETKTGQRLYGFTQPSDADFFANGNVSTLEGEWDAVTYRVGGEYDLNDKTMAYALYATGYQPGQLTSDGQTDEQELDQYTLGIKTDLLGSRLRVNLEGFHSTYYNRDFRGGLSSYSEGFAYDSCNDIYAGMPGPGEPVVATDGAGNYCIDGIQATLPELLSMGVDLEINFLITENDRIDASGEWLKSEQSTPEYDITVSDLTDEGFADTEATSALAGLADYAASYDGMTLQNSPEWSANFSYSHIFDLADGSTLTPKFNMEYKTKYYSQGGGPAADVPDPPDSYQEAYELYNFFLNWTSSDDRFNINAYVKNIGNTPVLTNMGAEGMETVSLLAPRTMGVVFSVKL
jgi:iron complex outermembrane receptor protein